MGFAALRMMNKVMTFRLSTDICYREQKLIAAISLWVQHSLMMIMTTVIALSKFSCSVFYYTLHLHSHHHPHNPHNPHHPHRPHSHHHFHHPYHPHAHSHLYPHLHHRHHQKWFLVCCFPRDLDPLTTQLSREKNKETAARERNEKSTKRI